MNGSAIDSVNEWAELWPLCFRASAQDRVPLRVGIRDDLVAYGYADDVAVAALRYYTGTSGYLWKLRSGATRFDLNGAPAGVVTDGQAAFAKRVLIKRRNRKEARRQQQEAEFKKAAKTARRSCRQESGGGMKITYEILNRIADQVQDRDGSFCLPDVNAPWPHKPASTSKCRNTSCGSGIAACSSSAMTVIYLIQFLRRGMNWRDLVACGTADGCSTAAMARDVA